MWLKSPCLCARVRTAELTDHTASIPKTLMGRIDPHLTVSLISSRFNLGLTRQALFVPLCMYTSTWPTLKFPVQAKLEFPLLSPL